MEIGWSTWRRVYPFIAGAGLFFGIWEANCVWFSRLHLGKGDAANTAGDRYLARLEWESAASRPAPWNPYSREAMGRLVSLERGMETEGRYDEALRLCFSIRGIAETTGGYKEYFSREMDFAAGRIPVLAQRLGTEIAPERYTLLRPIRSPLAHLAILSFAGFILAVRKASRCRDHGVTAAYAAAGGFFIAWLILLRFA